MISFFSEYDLNKIVTNPQVKNILAANNKRFIVFHPNGTIESLDKVDLDSQSNSKFRLVHSTPKKLDDDSAVVKGEVVNETPAPPHVPTTISKLPLHRLPPNVNPKVVDTDTKPLPPSPSLPVEDTNLKVSSVIKPVGFPPRVDESYAVPPPPPPPSSFEAPQENDKVKIVSQPVFEPKNTNEPEDEETSKPLPPNETQPINENTKPQPEEPVQPVNQNQFLRPYRPLPPYARRPLLRPPFKPLPPYARNKFQPLPREQPANDETINPVVENNEPPSDNLPVVEKDSPVPLNSEPKPINPPSDVDQPAGNGKPETLKPLEKVAVYDGSFQPIEHSYAPIPSLFVTSSTLSPNEPENKLPKNPRRKLIRRPPTTTTPGESQIL